MTEWTFVYDEEYEKYI